MKREKWNEVISFVPYCPFCCRNHNSRRGEHVLPKWLAREFPDVKWDITNRLTNYNRKGEKYIHITTPVPCGRCNSGWMSDLEQISKPILVPLIHGSPTILTIREQIIIAKWFFKTAVMYDLHSEKQAPRPRYFEDDEHRLLKSSLAFNPSYTVFMGKYVGSDLFTIQEDHSGVSIAHRDDLQPIGNPVRAYALTLVIKHLVLQIFCAKIGPGVGSFYMRDFRPLCVQIATSPDTIEWPPPFNFNDLLIDEFIYRWSVSPPRP